MIPAKHGVNSFRKLPVARFVDTASVHPEVVQAITSGLFSAKPNLLVSNLALPSAIYQVPVCDFFCICPLCIRKDSIFGNLVANKVLGQAELAIAVVF